MVGSDHVAASCRFSSSVSLTVSEPSRSFLNFRIESTHLSYRGIIGAPGLHLKQVRSGRKVSLAAAALLTPHRVPRRWARPPGSRTAGASTPPCDPCAAAHEPLRRLVAGPT
jgi:hypothetical protein